MPFSNCLNELNRLSFFLAISTIYFAVVAIILLAIGPSTIINPCDVFTLLDGAWRIHSNQIPHTDFYNPIGVLPYAISAWLMDLGYVSLSAVSIGIVIFLVSTSLWCTIAAYSRLRPLIKARTDDGTKRAKERGVRFGRPRKLDAHQREEALRRLANGETLVDVARTYGVDPTTIGRLQSPVVVANAAA
jgi:hypothetical protein